MANKKAGPAGEPGVRTDARQVSLAELKAVQSGITEHWDIREDPQVHRQADHGERERERAKNSRLRPPPYFLLGWKTGLHRSFCLILESQAPVRVGILDSG